MRQVYAPGCALIIYKPLLAAKVLAFLSREFAGIDEHTICCMHEPRLKKGTRIINTCGGCSKRYSELYDGVTTISLWEILASSETFLFPDYHGVSMSIHDICPTRHETGVHDAVRTLLARMKINVLEPEKTRTKAVCCGDNLYGHVPVETVKTKMRQRADEMPCDDVVVYCVSCIKSMHIGGKKPRYLVDLLFNESTEIGTFEPDAWHDEVQAFIDTH